MPAQDLSELVPSTSRFERALTEYTLNIDIPRDTSVLNAQTHEVIETSRMNIRVERGTPQNPNKKNPELKPGQYSGGSQVEGWSPLNDRTPWSVPPAKKWIPNWYAAIRPQLAEFLELSSRLHWVYRLGIIAALFAIAPVVPGLSWANVPFIAGLLMFKGKINHMDPLVRWVANPLMALVTPALAGIMYVIDKVSYASPEHRAKTKGKEAYRSALDGVFNGQEPAQKN